MSGQEFYERHRDDCVEWGIPAPPPWSELPAPHRVSWEQASDDFITKLTNDKEANS